MKTVITTTNAATIDLDAVLRLEFPIIAFRCRGEKVFLMPDGYKGNSYHAKCLSGFERGNHYDPDGKTTNNIKAWVKYLDAYTMLLFDTPQELFSWLAE